MMNNDAEKMLESGIPPDWFPPDKKIDFRGKRRVLLSSKTLDDLREDVKAIIKMRREHFADPNYLKFEYSPGIINGLLDTVGHDLAILARYLYAAALGEEKGLPLLIGNETLVRVRKASSKKANDAKHDKPGASRDLHKQIREVWAKGNFTTRDDCADQEGSAIGFRSFRVARRALINTPDPSPWPAKKTKK